MENNLVFGLHCSTGVGGYFNSSSDDIFAPSLCMKRMKIKSIFINTLYNSGFILFLNVFFRLLSNSKAPIICFAESLQPFLEACSNNLFFRTCSVLLRTPKLDLQILEKLSIILQKLSKIK